MTILNGVDFTEQLAALEQTAQYAENKASDFEEYADSLRVAANIALSAGFTNADVISIKYNAQRMRIMLNDMSNALNEIETQVKEL